jgi:hypothetical protein
MKAILEFNLPEEQEEFNNAIKANDYLSAIQEFKKYLRTHYKYETSLINENQQPSEEEFRVVKTIYHKFHQIVNENVNDFEA